MISQNFGASARQRIFGVLTALVVAIAFILPSIAGAQAGGIENLRRYAGIVVDAKTGEVLYQQNPDDARYPASITKVMTLYILFQELSAGRLKLNSMLTVSPFAAAASPTKLGLRAGSKIAVEDAIKSIVTISANDMARTIAENISGDEATFARRMTATARAMGMAHTTYVNASGLPDARQRTTVRDQAILARAVFEHFPQYYAYFQTHSFQYGRRVYGNHDNVLGFMGVDGLKTGYINAAGYNLMTASRLNNRHIVVIGFGFNSGGARDAMVRSLVAKYLPKAHQGGYLQTAMIQVPGRQQKPTIMLASADPAAVANPGAAPLVSPMPLPAFRQDDQAMPEPVAYAPEPAARTDAGDTQAVAPMDIGVRPAVAALSAIGDPSHSGQGAKPDVTGQSLNQILLGAPPTPLGQTRGSAPLLPPVGIGDGNQPVDLMTSGSISGPQVAAAALEVEAAVFGRAPSAAMLAATRPPATVPETRVASLDPEPVAAAAPASAAPAPAGSWIVQIGAAPTQDGANGLLDSATHKLASLKDLRPYVERFDKGGQTFYRARFVGFGGKDEATTMCNQLKKAKMSCLAMQS